MDLTVDYFRTQVNIFLAIILSTIRQFSTTTTPDIETANSVVIDSTQPDLSASILAFCFASALAFLILHFQSTNDNNNTHIVIIPLSVHLFCLPMSCSFASIFISQFVATKFAEMLKKIGYVFAAVAFFLAVAIPSPLWLRIVYCCIFLLASFIIFTYGYMIG